MRRPVIGVTPLVDIARESYWMLPGYMQGVEAAGGAPVMLPLTEDLQELDVLLRLCDGLLLTGGQDVSPQRYGEEPLSVCGERCPQRDAMESALLRMAMERDMPVLGICRGIQLMNVCLGGTLYQDLPTQHPSAVVHCQRPPYDRPSHAVELEEPLARLLGSDRLSGRGCLPGKNRLLVNSYHHQAVKTLAPSLQAMARSEDGLTEAVCCPDRRFFWAVQWHPEFAYRSDADSLRILQAFVDAARG